MPCKRNAGQDLMGKLAATGVKEVQLHEPALVMWDSSQTLAAMFKKAYFSDKVRGMGDDVHQLIGQTAFLGSFFCHGLNKQP